MAADERRKFALRLKSSEDILRKLKKMVCTAVSFEAQEDELGREATNMLLEKVVDSEIYQPMIDREMLTYEVFNKGGKHEIACLYVTLKGMRYCITFGDEISSRRPVDPAGVPRK